MAAARYARAMRTPTITSARPEICHAASRCSLLASKPIARSAGRRGSGLGSVAGSWLCFGVMLAAATIWVEAGPAAFGVAALTAASTLASAWYVRRRTRRYARDTVITHERLTCRR